MSGANSKNPKIVTLQRAQQECKSSTLKSLCFARNMIDAEYPVHIHDCYELELLTEGEAVHWMNGNRCMIRPGSIFLMSPEDFHGFSTTVPLHFFTIKIGKETQFPGLAALLQQEQKGVCAQLEGDEYEAMLQFFLQLEAEFQQRAPYYENRIDAMLVMILTKLYRCQISPSKAELAPITLQTIRKALSYLRSHLQEEMTLKQLAAYCNLTPNYFSALFRKVVGCGFSEYLLNQRINLACQCLATTDETIADIAFQTGFGAVSTFQRVFRQKKNASPSQYRKQIAAQDSSATDVSKHSDENEISHREP